MSDLYEQQTRKVRRASGVVQALAVVGGGLAAVAAAIASSKGPTFTAWEVVAITSGILVVLAGAFGVITRDDPSDALFNARKAIDEAEQLSAELTGERNAIEGRLHDMARLRELYVALRSIGEGLEQATTARGFSEEQLITTILTTNRRELRIALGFQFDSTWTIGIYRVQRNSETNERELRCIASHRSVDCDPSDARVWSVGVGVMGIAVAKNAEVTAPDLQDPALGTTYELPDSMARDTDGVRYRSAFSCPVQVAEDTDPWGSVIATTSLPGHFVDDDSFGVAPEEAMRALAGAVAQAVALTRLSRESGSSAAVDNG